MALARENPEKFFKVMEEGGAEGFEEHERERLELENEPAEGEGACPLPLQAEGSNQSERR